MFSVLRVIFTDAALCADCEALSSMIAARYTNEKPQYLPDCQQLRLGCVQVSSQKEAAIARVKAAEQQKQDIQTQCEELR